jgi:hypothetical protein
MGVRRTKLVTVYEHRPILPSNCPSNNPRGVARFRPVFAQHGA